MDIKADDPIALLDSKNDAIQTLSAILDQLTPQPRKLLKTMLDNNLSEEEAAKKIGISVKCARSHLSQIKSKLKSRPK